MNQHPTRTIASVSAAGVVTLVSTTALADAEPVLDREAYELAASQEGFVAARREDMEQVNGGALMLIAYALFWVMVVTWVALLARRAALISNQLVDVRRQLTDLDDRLDELERSAP